MQQKQKQKSGTGLVWFRNDLRVTDQLSLVKACEHTKTIAVYCLDPSLFKKSSFGFTKMGKYRAKFLLESLVDLKAQLKALNIPLFVVLESPETYIPALVSKHHITTIYLQKEWTKEEVDSLKQVKEQLTENVTLYESYSQFLFHPDDIPYPNFDTIPNVFTAFRKKCEKYATVRRPISECSPKDHSNYFITENNQIPTLKDLGYSDFEPNLNTAFPFSGGSTAAKERIAHYFYKTENLAHYKETRNGLLGIDYSSKLSAWLANGSISAVEIYWEIQKFEKSVIKNQSTYWLFFELVWRDYFKYASLKYNDRLFYLSGFMDRTYDWHLNDRKKQQWIDGNTPDAFVNANMIELAKTGWMSNRGRQNVASYWSKTWQQDWRIGAAYFEEQLIDYDVHSNWGNWQYVSGIGNDPRNRKFNTKLQAERYDPQNTYQNLWLHEN
ncbi:DASH family cryptochrome [Croceivirga sp. JEA036]|uniref:DASH family cryptochrome n=1 Tax=Croceivirga sp. JEA036 TaxID=2721162 RepID=UPI001438B8F6|nr:DASH family cryptochrome [Croceivirga sp. JEA036]NJB35997.1 DASH family cryptochrome [Croceivirga sp. JEA036]